MIKTVIIIILLGTIIFLFYSAYLKKAETVIAGIASPVAPAKQIIPAKPTGGISQSPVLPTGINLISKL